MKKIILSIIITFISLFWFSYISHAEGSESNSIEVKISADFSPILPWTCFPANSEGEYICAVPKWVSWFEVIMGWIIKYIVFIASLAWVLFIVINWILYSMWWADDSLKTDAKKRIMQTLWWIILLLLSWVILHIIAPWVYS